MALPATTCSARIKRDPDSFVASLDEPDGRGAPATLLDGTTVPRLASIRRSVWSDTFGALGGGSTDNLYRIDLTHVAMAGRGRLADGREGR
ncbi:MAG: hypothetical protein AAGK69_04695 [Pseudomonadota bacterium]